MSDAIVLPERLDLSSVPALAATLRARPADEKLSVDASAVTHFGALGLQVLMSAAIRNNAAGGAISLHRVPDRVLGQMTAMGTSPAQIVETRK
ncbi:MAG: STAS domain-containing protein [Pseudomonadota bacterium]